MNETKNSQNSLFLQSSFFYGKENKIICLVNLEITWTNLLNEKNVNKCSQHIFSVSALTKRFDGQIQACLKKTICHNDMKNFSL